MHWAGFFLRQSEMDRFQHQAPFVFAAGGLAVAAGHVVGALPRENFVERVADQRFLAVDGDHQVLGVVHVAAHVSVARVAGGGTAMLFADAIAFLSRTQNDAIIERQFAPQVGTCGSFVAKAGLDRAVIAAGEGQAFIGPAAAMP